MGLDAVEGVVRQIQAEILVALFQTHGHRQALEIVLEAQVGLECIPVVNAVQRTFKTQGIVLVVGHDLMEDPLTRMAERGVAQVMSQGNGLHQIDIQLQGFGNGPGDLGYLQGMGQPGALLVIHTGDEHLGFAGQAPEGRTVQHPVPVPHKLRAVGGSFFLFVLPHRVLFIGPQAVTHLGRRLLIVFPAHNFPPEGVFGLIIANTVEITMFFPNSGQKEKRGPEASLFWCR